MVRLWVQGYFACDRSLGQSCFGWGKLHILLLLYVYFSDELFKQLQSFLFFLHFSGYILVTVPISRILFCHLIFWVNDRTNISLLQIFYFIGFGLFCLESMLSVWVIQVQYSTATILVMLRRFGILRFFGSLVQQVYMYFRGSGKAAEMKREAARSTMMAAL